jgi:hypothetical protein
VKPDAHSPPERGNRSLSDARRQLGRAIGDALSGSLGALSGRLRGNSSAEASRAAAKSKYRLREVLSTDRSNVGLAELNTPLDFSNQPPPSAATLVAEAARSAVEPAPELAPSRPLSAVERATSASPAGTFNSEPFVPTTTAELLDALAPPPEPEPAPRARSVPPPLPRRSEPPRAVETQPQPAAMSPQPSAAAATPPSPQPSAADDDKPSVWDEPIRTRSMARLLASQGHHQRALAIYDLLLSANDADASLRAEADTLRGQLLSA